MILQWLYQVAYFIDVQNLINIKYRFYMKLKESYSSCCWKSLSTHFNLGIYNKKIILFKYCKTIFEFCARSKKLQLLKNSFFSKILKFNSKLQNAFFEKCKLQGFCLYSAQKSILRRNLRFRLIPTNPLIGHLFSRVNYCCKGKKVEKLAVKMVVRDVGCAFQSSGYNIKVERD